MRDYQVRGLNWMISLYENGINGILADEMVNCAVVIASVLTPTYERFVLYGLVRQLVLFHCMTGQVCKRSSQLPRFYSHVYNWWEG